MALDIQRQIDELRQHPELGRTFSTIFQRIEDAINHLGTNAGVDPTGAKLPPPRPLQSFNVQSDGNGTFHGVISHDAELQRGIHYFAEWDTNPAFSKPRVVPMHVSRTMPTQTLPHKDGDGNVINYYWRAYAQYPGSDPGEKMNFGGETPTPLNAGGATQMNLFASTGSGSAQNSGEEGGSGFGKVLFRPASGVKRTSAQNQ
jgi:hypothetical protein